MESKRPAALRQAPPDRAPEASREEPSLSSSGAVAAAAALLAACGGADAPVREAASAAAAPTESLSKRALDASSSMTSSGMTASNDLTQQDAVAPVAAAALAPLPSFDYGHRDAARFLAQATFGPRSINDIVALRAKGFSAWINEQFALPAFSHSAYIESQRGRGQKPGARPRVTEEMSYEAFWQQWLLGQDQLRARVSWALIQILVVSNIAPDIRPVAMSTYMDVLQKNAFGNFRTLLQDVTLNPAMGYYLNHLENEKENPQKGTHPNENYAREVLQLFSIGLVQLNPDGTPKLDAQGKTIPTYDENVVKGFAKVFTGWAYGGLDNTKRSTFHNHDDNDERLWRVPMIAWQMWHSTGTKQLLNGTVLPAGQTAEKDMADAMDNIFNHPNVGPFICKQLIQRLVMSNPSPGYVQRVATVFANNGAGVRGDMKAVIRAILLDSEARGDGRGFATTSGPPGPAPYGKQREPVIRFANFLRALQAASRNGRNDIHYLDSPDDALGQSPLLAPSVFNFYSPFFRPAGPVAQAGMVAPEFQITSEITVVGSLNFFAKVIESSGYGGGESRMRIDYTALRDLARDTSQLVAYLDQLFFFGNMSASTRDRIRNVVNAVPLNQRTRKVKNALILVAMAPDFVIQR